MPTHTIGNTCGQKCHAKGSRKETEIQEFMYRDTRYVEMNCVIMVVIIGATRIATKGLKKYFEAIQENTQ